VGFLPRKTASFHRPREEPDDVRIAPRPPSATGRSQKKCRSLVLPPESHATMAEGTPQSHQVPTMLLVVVTSRRNVAHLELRVGTERCSV
jgi:hypothetical protein